MRPTSEIISAGVGPTRLFLPGHFNTGGGGESGGTTVSGSSLMTGLLAYWKMNESSGARLDATGRGNDLTDNNGASYGMGVRGSAVIFDGSTWLNGGTGGDFSFAGGAFSVSCWARMDELSTIQVIWGKYQLSEGFVGPQVYFDSSTGKFTFNIFDNDGTGDTNQYLAHSTEVEIGTWYHIVAIFDGTNMSLTVNGVTETSAWTGNPILSEFASTFSVAVNYENGPGYFMAGGVDELGKWNRALLPIEISTLYNGGLGIPY